MLDSEEFSNRLKLIMDTNHISATLFAEKLNVPRSSISHLLSGRNKPSLEFVLKVLKNFPDVELYWLLNGDGVYPMPLAKKQDHTPTLFNEQDSEQQASLKVSQNIQNKNEFENPKSDEIDRIVIFFKDGSFKSYSS